jgi:HEPN domain-containing protein/predicted nucleotidyltransferase
MTDEPTLPDRFPPDDPREWLRMAREDLTLAQAEIAGVGFEVRAYHAQQAAEKALKAVCIARGLVFPYTHAIERLLQVLQTDGLDVMELAGAERLTRFATDTRYPSRPQLDRTDFAELIGMAHGVLEWAVPQASRGPGRIRERAPRVYDARAIGAHGPDPSVLDDVIARIVAAAAPVRIILFGSGARGSMGPHSDLDLLVVSEEDDEVRRMDAAIRRALAGIEIEVDLVVATTADLERYGRSIGLVYRPALEEGRVIYSR